MHFFSQACFCDHRLRSPMEAFKSEWLIMGNLQRWRFNLVKASNDNNRTSQKHQDEAGANEEKSMRREDESGADIKRKIPGRNIDTSAPFSAAENPKKMNRFSIKQNIRHFQGLSHQTQRSIYSGK